MSDNTIRRDLIEISFKTNLSGLDKANSAVDELKKSVLGVSKATSEMDKLKNSTDKLSSSMSGVEKASRSVSKATQKFQSVNRAIQDGSNCLANLKSAIKNLPSNTVNKLSNSLSKVKTQAQLTVGVLKSMAKYKLNNLKQSVEGACRALTQGQKGAKGFVTALKSIGKISVAKLAASIKNVATGLSNIKTKLKSVASTSFSKLKSNLKNIATKLSQIATKAAVTAFKALKKIAGISFKALIGGITGATAAVGALVTKSVQAYADFEQLKGGVETLFGANGAKSVEEYAKIVGKSVDKVKDEYKSKIAAEKEVVKNANQAFKTAGLSANAYMETVTGFSASLISSVGGDTKKAASLAHTAIVDMSD